MHADCLPHQSDCLPHQVRNLEMANFTELAPDACGTATKFHLMCSIQHDGLPEAGSYRGFVHFRANDAWYEVQDLHVNGVHPQLISVSESYIQVLIASLIRLIATDCH